MERISVSNLEVVGEHKFLGRKTRKFAIHGECKEKPVFVASVSYRASKYYPRHHVVLVITHRSLALVDVPNLEAAALSVSLKVLLYLNLGQVLSFLVEKEHLKVEYKKPSSIKEVSSETYGFGLNVSDGGNEPSVSPNVLSPGSVRWEPGSASTTDDSEGVLREQGRELDSSHSGSHQSHHHHNNNNSSSSDLRLPSVGDHSNSSSGQSTADKTEGSTVKLTYESLHVFFQTQEECADAVEAIRKGAKEMHAVFAWVSSGLPAPKHTFQIASVGIVRAPGSAGTHRQIRGPQAWRYEVPLPEAWVELLDDMPPLSPDSCFPRYNDEWFPPGTRGHPGYYLFIISTPLGLAGCLLGPRSILAAAVNPQSTLQVLAFPLPVGFESQPLKGWLGNRDAATFDKGVHVVVEVSLVLNERLGDSDGDGGADDARCNVSSMVSPAAMRPYNGPKRRRKAPAPFKAAARALNLPESTLPWLQYGFLLLLAAIALWLLLHPVLLMAALFGIAAVWVFDPSYCTALLKSGRDFLLATAMREKTPFIATSSKYSLRLERAQYVHALIGYPVEQLKAFKDFVGVSNDDKPKGLPTLLAEPEPEWLQSDVKARFLAAKSNLRDSRRLAEMTHLWRSSNDIDRLLLEPPPEFWFFMENIPHQVLYTDGSLVALRLEVGKVAALAAAMKASKLPTSAFQMHIAFLHEYMWNNLAPAGLPAGRMDQIIDMKNFSLSHMMGDTKEIFLSLMQVGNYFPERLGRCVIVNPPGWFNFVWNFAAPFLDENTKARIEVVSNKEQTLKELSRMLTPDLVPQSYGGSCTTKLDNYETHQEMLRYVRQCHDKMKR